MSKKHLRGFGSLSKERRAEIASLGGKAAQEQGRGHQFTSAEAVAAGKKGGRARRARIERSEPARAMRLADVSPDEIPNPIPRDDPQP